MHKKIRLIQKGQAGFQFVQQGLVGGLVPTTAGSVLDQNTINAINQQQTNIWKAQQDEQAKIRQQQISQGYQTASNALNPISSGLTNFGIISGNYAMANLGQLGSSLSSGLQLMSNWKNLSKQDKAAGVAGIGGQAVDTLDNMFFGKQHAKDSGLTKGLNNTYNSISNAAMMFSPVGTIVGGAMKAGKFIGDGLSALVGGGTDQMTTTDKIMDSTFGRISGVGLFNDAFGKTTQQFSANNDTIEKVGGDYADSVNTIEDAVSKAGKKYGLFSNGARKRANRLIDTARTQQNIMTNISNEYQDQLANKSYLAYTRYGQDINGGIQQQYLRAAKHGAILQRINLRKHRKGGQLKDKIDIEVKQEQWQPIINLEYPEVSKLKEGGQLEESKEWTPIISLDIQKLEEGGKTDKPKQELDKIEETNQKNVIPEGALHAHKHHMENAEDLTKKGIPVVDNKGEQQAEIERNEIIFSLEVTKQLEDLHKRYQGYTNTQKEKDKLAIEAGKLLVYEILHNTEDRTGLIKECKKGGTLDGNK